MEAISRQKQRMLDMHMSRQQMYGELALISQRLVKFPKVTIYDCALLVVKSMKVMFCL